MNIVIQGIGFCGILINAVVYQQKDRQRLLLYKWLSDGLWLLHYILLGAYSGAAIALIACVREWIFMRNPGSRKMWGTVFAGMAIVSAVLTWKGASSLLPMAASVIAVVSFAVGNPHRTRLLCFPVSACMLTYDALSSSYAGIFNELLALASATLGLLHHDRKTQNEKEKSQ